MSASEETLFRVGFSADFRNEDGNLAFPDIGLQLFEAEPRVSYGFMAQYSPEYQPDQLAPYDVVISLKPRVTRASLSGVERLAAIGRFGVGYDNIDLEACTESDVAVYIAAGAVSRSMAESVVLLVLALSHNLAAKDRFIRRGAWAESTREIGYEPLGKTLGTIGLGGIASEVIRFLQPFRLARVLAFDPYIDASRFSEMGAEPTGLDKLLARSDYVVINCPLTAETRHLISEREFQLMKPTAFLVNTARGPIVDETALIQALERRVIRGAALDVFEREPLPADSPLVRLENVILTSHSIGWTEELFREIGEMDCRGALQIYRGAPPVHVVNPEVLARPGFQQRLERYRAALPSAESSS